MNLRLRHSSAVLVLSLISAAGLSWTPQVYAAPAAKPAEAPGAAEAKKHFEQGLRLHREGLFQEALAEFQRANSLAPRASIQRNIAQCHRDLKDLPKAYEAYETLLRDYTSTLRPPEIEEVKRVLDELSAVTGGVDVKITEPGAKITIDGVEVGTTPLPRALRVRVGSHRLVATKDGFQPLNFPFESRGGDQTTVDSQLAPVVSVGVVSVPAFDLDPTMHMFVDGTDAGVLPWSGELKEGSHELRVEGDTYFVPAQSLTVAAGSKLTPSLSPQPYLAQLTVDAHQPDARIYLDNKQVGAGLWTGELPLGQHKLRVMMSGFDNYEQVVSLRKNDRVSQSVVLKPTKRVVAQEKRNGKGPYFGIEAIGAFSTTSGAITADCTDFTPNTDSGACSGSKGKGGGVDIRAGYSFGYLGVEFIAFGSFDSSSATVEYDKAVSPNGSYENPNVPKEHYGVQRTESYKIMRKSGGAALGLRLSSDTYPFGATMGAAFGFVVSGSSVDRSFTCLENNCGAAPDLSFSSNALYTVPAFLFDAGFELGSPASRFRLGVVAMVHLLDYNSNAPGGDNYILGNKVPLAIPDVTVFRGTQVFIGPQMGMNFGL